jgi:peptidase E
MPDTVQPIYLFADSQLLFWVNDDRPFLATMMERIDTERPKAAYIGASNGDDPAYYSIFEGAMESIGILDRRLISSEYPAEDEEYLREADIILLSGGDVGRGWQIMKDTGMDQVIVERHRGNAILIGVSAGAVLLGIKGWTNEDPQEDQIFDALELVPYVIDAHDEKDQWKRLKRVVSLAPLRPTGVALPAGAGAVYHPDMTLEPVRRPIIEITLNGDEVTQTLLLPPNVANDEKDSSSELP